MSLAKEQKCASDVIRLCKETYQKPSSSLSVERHAV